MSSRCVCAQHHAKSILYIPIAMKGGSRWCYLFEEKNDEELLLLLFLFFYQLIELYLHLFAHLAATIVHQHNVNHTLLFIVCTQFAPTDVFICIHKWKSKGAFPAAHSTGGICSAQKPPPPPLEAPLLLPLSFKSSLRNVIIIALLLSRNYSWAKRHTPPYTTEFPLITLYTVDI